MLQGSHNGFNVAVRSRNIKIAYLGERNQFFRSPQEADDIRHKIAYIRQTDVFRIIQAVIVRQILHISFLENHQFPDHPVFYHLTAIIVRIHVGNKPRQPVGKERGIGTQIEQFQIIIGPGILRKILRPGFQAVNLMKRILPFLGIRHNAGMLLYRLFGRNHPTLAHQFVNPAYPAIFKSFQHLVFHLKTLVNGNPVLHHFIHTGVLFHKRRFYQTHQNVGVTFIIIRTLGALNHTDIEQHHPAAHPVYLILSHFNILLAQDVVVDFIQLGRHNLADKLFPEHAQFVVLAVFDFLTEIFQFADNQIIERIVITQQIEVENLVGDTRGGVVDSGSHRVHNIPDGFLRQSRLLESGQFSQLSDKLVQPDIEIQVFQFDAYHLFKGLPRHLDNLAPAGLQALLLKRQVEMQQYLPDVFFQNHINSFQLRLIQFGPACRIHRQNLHLAVGEKNMFHLYQNLPHDILLHRLVEHIVIGLKRPFVRNVL